MSSMRPMSSWAQQKKENVSKLLLLLEHGNLFNSSKKNLNFKFIVKFAATLRRKMNDERVDSEGKPLNLDGMGDFRDLNDKSSYYSTPVEADSKLYLGGDWAFKHCQFIYGTKDSNTNLNLEDKCSYQDPRFISKGQNCIEMEKGCFFGDSFKINHSSEESVFLSLESKDANTFIDELLKIKSHKISVKDKIDEHMYLFFNEMPFERGSASIGEMVKQALYMHFNLDIDENNVREDVVALLSNDYVEFKKNKKLCQLSYDMLSEKSCTDIKTDIDLAITNEKIDPTELLFHISSRYIMPNDLEGKEKYIEVAKHLVICGADVNKTKALIDKYLVSRDHSSFDKANNEAIDFQESERCESVSESRCCIM